ncbi:MAG TPA: thioredoxin domain-containing protein [Rhizomicrobium sp.]|nr:thioredoxin domain-containing protein [Rhizomicrobium sp.]
MSRNLLDQETSPYLLLHKDNPVHWRPWGADALAEAEQSNKPILLSIGYTACHWCHVMNHESFADPETAALMNELFVNIKVDREERPDLDQLYQTASNQMGHTGGWPLTMFLTPRGEPYIAAGYLSRGDRQGTPDFKRALQQAAQIYRDEPERVGAVNQTVAQSLTKLWGRNLSLPPEMPVISLDFAAMRIGQRFDVFHGGVTGALKFPSFALVEVLWHGFLRTAVPPFLQLVQASADAMSLGGIYDHIGGGISRYTTDENWLVPHFEKMLYDNAQYIHLLTLLWQGNRNPLYAERVEETVNWLLREMAVEGGFASSLDAESEGQEGLYYTWTEAEIDAALAGTFTQRFKQAYHVTREGNFHGRNILHRLGQSPYPLPQADEALLKNQRARLLAARAGRTLPLRDDKVLADCNGLVIAALANAGFAFRKTQWIQTAIKAFDFVVATLGQGDRLHHSWRAGKVQHMGFSDDYAHMARAALALFEVTGEKRFLTHARGWAHVLGEHFWDSQNGGYFYTSDDDEMLMLRARTVIDQSIPSANATMIGVLARLYFMTGENAYRERSNALIQAFSGEMVQNFMAMGSFFNELEVVMHGLQIVIVGPRDNTATLELVAAVAGRSLPTRALIVLEPGETLPEGHPAFGKTMQDGRPTAYICQRMTCSVPITNPVTLSQNLQLPRVAQPMPAPVGNA